jgi:hypothetical protein
MWTYSSYSGWQLIIVYDPATDTYSIPAWNPNQGGASLPAIPPVPVYDSRNQIIAYITGAPKLSVTNTGSSLTPWGGAPASLPPGPPYPATPGTGDWVGSAGSSGTGWIDPQPITIPDSWWAWNDQVERQILYVQRHYEIVSEQDVHGVGLAQNWQIEPQWDFNGTWVSAATVYFYPDSANRPPFA